MKQDLTRRTALAATPAVVAGMAAAPAGARAGTSPTEAVRVVIERYAAAWARADVAAYDCYHPQFTLHYFGRNALSGDHVGKAASIAKLTELARRTRARLVRVIATTAGPDRGTIIARMRMGAEGREIEVDRVMVYTVEDGLLRDCWQFNQDERLIDELVGTA
jgi:hypothetical protein